MSKDCGGSAGTCSTVEKKKVAIAMQGGGAHGAFAWGVMDRLLEDERIEVVGASGTSAGGMNAASMIEGLIKGHNAGGRAKLNDYWREMAALSKKSSPYQLNPLDKMAKYYNLDHSFGYYLMGAIQSFFCPYEWNPSNKNPFLEFLRDFFDFQAVRNSEERKIFLGATHVKTGKVKVFGNDQFCADALMASACLPFLYQSVKVDGEYYWDGGFIANPAIFPLIYNTSANDILLIQLTKSHTDEIPRSKAAVTDRLKEITYNGCLVHEMRAIHLISKMIDEGKIVDPSVKRISMHVIKNEDSFKSLNLSSALDTEWDFLQLLKNEGRKTADRWLLANYNNLGSKCHTLDEAMFSDFVG
ncbi:MAG: patatin-like phospholipase family protein [Holosporaceae bacterium]|jgi:NTE family protein|nr:patatin-like phospholipase family protein [Holosporaceae bacterium]